MSFIQRFTQDLRLFPHVHVLVPDGRFLLPDRIVAAQDRTGLERLCRYGLRAPFSVERFSVLPDGRVRYELRKAAGGRTELHLEPLDLLRRPVALLRPQRFQPDPQASRTSDGSAAPREGP